MPQPGTFAASMEEAGISGKARKLPNWDLLSWAGATCTLDHSTVAQIILPSARHPLAFGV
jgi:hypothetical protein